MKATLSLIAAVAENGVIGRRGELPWHLSTDMRRFKRLTIGKPVIMGRKTAESLAEPLVERTNIVLSSQVLTTPGFLRVTSLEEALTVAVSALDETGGDEIMVIGGGDIYRSMIGQADRLYVTHIKAVVEGDTHFPPIDPGRWQVVAGETISAGERDSYATQFTVYERHRSMRA